MIRKCAHEMPTLQFYIQWFQLVCVVLSPSIVSREQVLPVGTCWLSWHSPCPGHDDSWGSCTHPPWRNDSDTSSVCVGGGGVSEGCSGIVYTITYILWKQSQFTVRLAASNEPSSIDHTGEIISFTDIGSGGGAPTYPPPRPWVCYTTNTNNVVWQFPDGTAVPAGAEIATGDQLITRINERFVLLRGPTHNSPDGEHCCVRTGTSERRCVTFSEWSEL